MRVLAASLLIIQLGAATAIVAQTPTSTNPAPPDSTARATRRPIRRLPVTPELLRTAFVDAPARTLLDRARAARLAQDSALRAYDAKTYQRLSVGLGLRRIGRERMLLRTEQAARVRWARGAGVWVEPTGRRTAFPMGSASLDLTAITPIPYFPGRESLWIPSGDMGVAKAEVNEDEMLHPLAGGAEAYYRYATGDSVSLQLSDGRIALRELRITARRPEWRAFVGSFWFDVDRGNLVRAAYRMAAEMDIWQNADEEAKRGGEDAPPWLAKAIWSPMRANLSAITVEYGLHEGRFWLPRLNVAVGEIRAGPIRLPMKFEESFRYNSVNGTEPVPTVPTPAEVGLAEDDTTWVTGGNIALDLPIDAVRNPRIDTSAAARLAREDSLIQRYNAAADSLRGAAERARAKGDTSDARRLDRQASWSRSLARRLIRHREGCATDSTYLAGFSSRLEGALRMAIRLPCDTTHLANSPDLPGSIYEPGEEIFGSAESHELLKTLDFSLQPDWAPQPPVLHSGLDLVRYNRIEGLSVGASATSVLGRGYTAQAVGRIGTSDWIPNGELSISRSNGRAEMRLGVFHRLGVANDDWGAPLSFGASVANVLYARDEGFYYRAFGAELGGTRDAPGPLGGATLLWRIFAERQRSAGRDPNTQASLGNAIGSARFEPNIDAVALTALGAGGALARTFGADPSGTRLDARLRGEGAFTDRSDSVGTTGYGRLVVDGTLSHGFGRLAAAITGAAGTAVGDLPPQRAFYVGGLHTVRGQFARPDGVGRVGDAFWLGRAELGFGLLAARPSIFYDVGWAGRRADLMKPGRPLSGAGVGLSLLDGLLRIDLARGIWPEERWRADLYLEARF